MNRLIAFFVAALYCVGVLAQTAVLPRPASVEAKKGVFNIPAEGLTFAIKGDVDGSLAKVLETYGWKSAEWKKASVRITCGESLSGEGYEMAIGNKYISIDAPSEAGAFYGAQSLRQIAAEAVDGVVSACKISDAPRFPYRGLHFDVSRNFRSLDFLKKQVDAMARLKLNRMHLHLTDGAGWRMEDRKSVV